MRIWPFGRPTGRRAEIRRARAERRLARLKRLGGRTVLSVGITVGTAVAAAVILNSGGPVLDVREGQVLPRAVTARVSFEIQDDQKTLELRLRARDRSPNYFVLDTALLDDIQARLTSALTLARAHAGDPQKLREETARNKVRLDDGGLSELQRLAGIDDGTIYQRNVNSLIARLRQQPLVNPEVAGVRPTAEIGVLFDPGAPQERRLAMPRLSFADAETVAKVAEEAAGAFTGPLRTSIRESLIEMLRTDAGEFRPLYRFDLERSADVAKRAYDEVPVQHLNYEVGAVLAGAGIVTAAQLNLLAAEHRAWLAQQARAGTDPWLSGAARSALVLVVVIGVAICMARVRRAARADLGRRAATAATLLAVLALTRFGFVHNGAPPALAVGMHSFAAGLLGIVFPHDAVLVVCVGLGLLMTLAVQQGPEFFVTLAGAAAVLVFGLREVRYRGKVVLVGLGAAGAVFLTTAAELVLSGEQRVFVLQQASWAAAAALMAAVVLEAVLPAVERLFQLSTAMTLLEWCDTSKPLLRMMAAEAPGTFNHSQVVGMLAEAGAEAIGANGLLARAGAYYHDIGKINKPEYFVENQLGAMSRHERLSPAMSLLIIVGHVKDGVEMAREYSLPGPLRPFIAEHHGTTLVEYFYHAATQSRRPDEPEISENEFRYPGPKPQSRETAIVMICDAVEGTVRAMAEPTPNRIEQVVGEIVRKRLADGQFDECDLTFHELAEVEKRVIKSLNAIYHARIVYPEARNEKKSAGASRAAS